MTHTIFKTDEGVFFTLSFQSHEFEFLKEAVQEFRDNNCGPANSGGDWSGCFLDQLAEIELELPKWEPKWEH